MNGRKERKNGGKRRKEMLHVDFKIELISPTFETTNNYPYDGKK